MQDGPQIDQIIANIRTQLREGNWEQHLWSFLSSNEMRGIVQQLVELKETGNRFVPGIFDCMSPYSLCKSHLVRCIIITSLKSNAVATAGKNKVPMQPTTAVISSLLSTVAKKQPDPHNWSTEGVLQISTAMTSTLNGDHHYNIWSPWTAYIVNKVNDLYPSIPWVIIGKEAQKYYHLIRSPHKFCVQTWPYVDSMNAWEKVNMVLTAQEKKLVRWDNNHSPKKRPKRYR